MQYRLKQFISQGAHTLNQPMCGGEGPTWIIIIYFLQRSGASQVGSIMPWAIGLSTKAR